MLTRTAPPGVYGSACRGWEKLVKRGLHTLRQPVYEIAVVPRPTGRACQWLPLSSSSSGSGSGSMSGRSSSSSRSGTSGSRPDGVLFPSALLAGGLMTPEERRDSMELGYWYAYEISR